MIYTVKPIAALATLLWFALNGLLWYARPHELLWLAGSAALAAVFFGGFLWYLAWVDKTSKL